MGRIILIPDARSSEVNRKRRDLDAIATLFYQAVGEALFSDGNAQGYTRSQIERCSKVVEMYFPDSRKEKGQSVFVAPDMDPAPGDVVLLCGRGVCAAFDHSAPMYRLVESQWPGVQLAYIPTTFKFTLMGAYPNEEPHRTDRARFTGWVRRLAASQVGLKVPDTLTRYKVCKTLADVQQLAEYVRQSGLMVFDFETRSKAPTSAILSEPGEPLRLDQKKLKAHALDFNRSVPTMLGISFQPGSGWIIPMYHYQSPFWANFEDGAWLDHFDRPAENPHAMAYTLNRQAMGPDMLNTHIWPIIRELFADKSVRKVAHNAKFDAKIAMKNGCDIRGIFDDTLIMHHMINESESHGLKYLADRFFPEFSGYGDDVDFHLTPLEELARYCAIDNDLTARLMIVFEGYLRKHPKLWAGLRNYERPKLKMLAEMEFRGMEVDIGLLRRTRQEAQALQKEIYQRFCVLPPVARYIEAKATEEHTARVEELQAKYDKEKAARIASCEKRGDTTKAEMVRNDARGIYKRLDQYRNQLLEVQKQPPVFEFSMTSQTHIQELLYADLHPAGYQFDLVVSSKKAKNPVTHVVEWVTKPRAITDRKHLSTQPDPDGVIELYLEYKALDKAISTYMTGIEEGVGLSGKIHSSYGTVETHRLSSRNPNLQNIPSRTKITEIRPIIDNLKRMFYAPPGRTFFQVDLSQAELRFAAAMWGIDTMQEVYRQRGDLHIVTATSMKGISTQDYYELKKNNPPEAKILRTEGKVSNFSLIFDISPDGFRTAARDQYGLHWTQAETLSNMESFFARHPQVRPAQDRQRDIARQLGYCETMFGFRRRLPNINASDPRIANKDGRKAINTPIQGTNGQWMVFGLVIHRLRNMFMAYDGVTTNTVHDSGIGHFADGQLGYVLTLRDALNDPPIRTYFGVGLEGVDMESDIELGANWKDLEEHRDAV